MYRDLLDPKDTERRLWRGSELNAQINTHEGNPAWRKENLERVEAAFLYLATHERLEGLK